MESFPAEKPTVSNLESVSQTDNELQAHPKTWHFTVKMMVLLNLCFMVFCGNLYGAGVSPGLAQLVQEFHSNYTEASNIISYCLLTIGLGAWVWTPTAVVIGKRPVLVTSQLVFVAGSIWGSQATSMQSLLGSRIVGGLGAGAVQAVGPAVVGELFYEKDYSKAMAAYTLSLCLGSQLGNLIGGQLIAARGWQWHFKLLAILGGINFITLLFFCPETAYIQDIADNANAADVDDDIRRHTDGKKQSAMKSLKQNLFYLRHPHVRGGGLRQWVLSFLLQIEYTFNPTVLLSSGMWGISLAWVAGISVIQNPLFAAPPFNWSPAEIGNWAVTSTVGVVVAFPIAGPLTDFVSKQIGKRRGHHMPEHRLYTLILPFLVGSTGLILFGYTYANGSYVGPAVGYAMQTSTLLLIPATILSYGVDSYPYDSAEVVSLMNAVTHLVPFGLIKTASDWLERDGTRKMFLDMAIIQWALIAGITVVLIFFGPFIRVQSHKIHAKYGAKRFL
ncbi:hypothetical protein NW767_010476 [Fusarium falciforme]|nr:hypothetical protein NW767_010476 [Fusarium falciforme]